MKAIRPSPGWTVALALALAAPAARAQSAPANAAIPSDEVVTLSAFDVTAEQAHGYTASETTTGTRFASKVSDLPFAVSVVTHEFMADFGAYNLNSQLAFVSTFSPSEVTGQFQLRGFASPTVLVDGFRRIGLVDTVDIERIEIIKGSAASIYGAIQPGGAVNIITRQPTNVPMEDMQLGAGSDNFFLATLYSSGPVGKSDKLFYRVDLSDQFTKYAEEFASQHKASVDLKFLYKPDERTNVTFSMEHYEDYEHPFNQVLTVTEKQVMPWAGNGITESQYYGMATSNLLNYNYAGPESYLHQRVSSATLAVEHRFSEVWSTKFGVNDFLNPYNDQMVGSGAYYPYGTGNVTLVNGIVQQPFTPEVKDQPQADWKPQRGGGIQLDNLFKFNTGPVNHQFLITTDYYELSQRSLTLIPTVGGSQATDYYALYSPYNPAGASYYTPQTTWSPALGYGWNTTLYGQNPSLYNGVTTDQWLASSDYGVFGSERATMFGDRLILMAGGRWDYVRNQVRNYNIPANGSTASILTEPTAFQSFDYNTSAWTYELGASYKVTKYLNVYANKSTAFNPQPQIDSYTGLALPNNTSAGNEFGFKSTFLDDRLTFSADQFLINEYNLVQTETDPVTSQKDTILTGQQQAKGNEYDLSYQVSNDLYILGDWGHTRTEVLQSNTLTFLNGLPVRRVPRNNVGVAVRYQFSHGVLRGLFLTADAKYYSKSLVNLGSGKSLIPGPVTTAGSAGTMYYVATTNTTYTLADPKITGEQKITSTPVNNVPLPGNGLLPYPKLPAGSTINYPVDVNGNPLPLANPSTPGVYTGQPEGVFVDDGRENNYNAPYAVFDAGLGYIWKWGKFNHKVQVNVTNLLNRRYTWGSGVPGLPFQVVGTYELLF